MIPSGPLVQLVFGALFAVMGAAFLWLRGPWGLTLLGTILLLAGLGSLWSFYLAVRAGVSLIEPEYLDPQANLSCRRCAGRGWVRGRVNGERCSCVRPSG
jgi:hypothetical protein